MRYGSPQRELNLRFGSTRVCWRSSLFKSCLTRRVERRIRNARPPLHDVYISGNALRRKFTSYFISWCATYRSRIEFTRNISEGQVLSREKWIGHVFFDLSHIALHRIENKSCECFCSANKVSVCYALKCQRPDFCKQQTAYLFTFQPTAAKLVDELGHLCQIYTQQFVNTWIFLHKIKFGAIVRPKQVLSHLFD